MTNLLKDLQGIALELKEMYENDQNNDTEELTEYLNDALDIEYRCNYKKEYKGAIIALTLGGPNIYLDSFTGTLKGYWGNEHFEIGIDDEVNNFIDNYFRELFDCI